jgi:hypothetical protein
LAAFTELLRTGPRSHRLPNGLLQDLALSVSNFSTMGDAVIVKTRKLMKNPLLGRKQVRQELARIASYLVLLLTSSFCNVFSFADDGGRDPSRQSQCSQN